MNSYVKKIYVCSVAAFILNAFLALSFAGVIEPFTGEIIEDTINIRADSTAGAESLCKVNKGQRLEVVSESYDWYKVRLPLQVLCFIKKGLVNTAGQGTGVVSADNVNIRLFPTESALIVGRADTNEPVTILGEANGWYTITPVKNSFGWVHKKFVRKAAPPEQRTEMQVSIVIPEIPKPAAIPAKQAPEAKAPAVPETDGMVTLTGLVKTYGNVINRPATHKLITKDKQVYLLKYNPASLNELVFHTVRITGRQVTLPKTKFPVIEVEKVEILD
jgi:uncharacterized protein YgiM (DUF1202 family)